MPEKRTTLLMKQVSVPGSAMILSLSYHIDLFFSLNYWYSTMSYLKSMSELTNRSVQEGNYVHTKEIDMTH